MVELKSMNKVAASLVALLLGALAASANAQAPDAIVDPALPVAKKSQAEWSRVWWQWAGSFDERESPVADRTGRLCGMSQEGPVWFLAGTYGTQRTIRRCTVPAGKYIFFPLINYVLFPTWERAITCDQAIESAAAVTDDVSSLVLELDGKVVTDLARHRQATRDCFDLAARAGGGITPSAANGYYVMLKPLKPGTHTLNFGGRLPDMTQAVTYTLIVE